MSLCTAMGQETGGVHSYFQTKADSLEITIRNKEMNLRRLQAQRNELNSKGEGGNPSWNWVWVRCLPQLG
jgi:hypothetical protein